MGALVLPLFVFGMGLVLYWAGYYVALSTAWRSGVRGIGTVLAMLSGLCCCGGVAVLAVHWEKIQKHTFAAIADGGDAERLGAQLTRFRAAAVVAVVGMVLQAFAGYLVPDDDGYDGSYSYDRYEDERGDPYVVAGSADVDEAPLYAPDEVGSIDDDSIDEAVVDPSIDDDAVEGGASGAELGSEGAGDAVSGIVAGLSRDRRAAFVLDPAGGRWVRLRRLGRITGIEPGMTVHVRADSVEDGVLVTAALEDSGIPPWTEMPRPLRLEAELGSPPPDRIGRWVIVPNVTATSATQIAAPDGSTLRVRAEPGLLTSGASYLALRGALVDTRPIERRGRVELWVLRADDVIAAQ